MQNYDVVPFKLDKDNCPFSWAQSWSILTNCEHYPNHKVGGEEFCQKCNHHIELVDDGNNHMHVKCSYKYTRFYKIKQWFKSFSK